MPSFLLRFLLLLCLALPAQAAPLLEAPAAVRERLEPFVAQWPTTAELRANPPLQLRLQEELRGVLATEGYFDPQVNYDAAKELLRIDPGPQTTVTAVHLHFVGALDAARQAQESKAWLLPAGAPFRQADWERAKSSLLRQLVENEYPAARLLNTRAEVDPAARSAILDVEVDSGPRHVFGELQVRGADRFGLPVVNRFNTTVRPGAPYRTSDLHLLLQALQAAPYYTGVDVHAEPVAEGDSPVAVPVQVNVQERAPYRASTGLGMSSNYGARADLGFRSIDFLRRSWELSSHLRWEQRRQSFFTDVFLPPDHRQRRDSFGYAYSQSEISGLEVERNAVGVSRKIPRATDEFVLGLVQERFRETDATGASSVIRVLVPSVRGSWWQLDDRLAPRRGWWLSGELAGAGRRLGSDSNFFRVLLGARWYQPLGRSTDLLARLDAGQNTSNEPGGVPAAYLFRTGGSQSVRGYAFESLGITEGSTVSGGRRLLVGSLETVRWLSGPWGVAAFVDAGEAQDAVRELLQPAVGYGVGLRWRSPVGPLALDAAYGERVRQWRLHFAIAIPF